MGVIDGTEIEGTVMPSFEKLIPGSRFSASSSRFSLCSSICRTGQSIDS
jgi:hypothetical protein